MVTFCLEINFQNCIGLTHRHVLSNMCTSTRAFLSNVVPSGPTVDRAAPTGDVMECTPSWVTVCWKRPHYVSFPLIRWPLRHPDGPTKYRLTPSIISSQSINMTCSCICACVHVCKCVVQAYFYTHLVIIRKEGWKVVQPSVTDDRCNKKKRFLYKY